MKSVSDLSVSKSAFFPYKKSDSNNILCSVSLMFETTIQLLNNSYHRER